MASLSAKSTPAKESNSKLEIPTINELYNFGNKLSFKLIFVDLQKVVVDALKAKFPPNALLSDEINIVQGKLESFLELNNIDCIVSSSNAFGLMDHGFDRSVCKVLNDSDNKIKTRVQQEIINKYHGEQPVGTAIIIETHDNKIKYLLHSPTRRTNYSIKGTDNIYMTIKAICNEIRIWNANNSDDDGKLIKNVLLTGLGTFYGAVSPEESARQSVIGWLLARIPKPKIQDINWNYAKLRQELIGYGGFNHFINYILQYPDNALTKSQQQKLGNVMAKLHPDNGNDNDNAIVVDTGHKDDGKKKKKKKRTDDCAIM